MRAKGAGQRSHSVVEDWTAWIPNEMGQLFDATRSDLESLNVILNITLDEALSLCKVGQFDTAKERATVFAGLFDRLAVRMSHVIDTIREHASHFGTVPNVKPLALSNFRGETAQRIAFMSSLLSKVVFRERTRFFHKLYSLDEIIGHLQREAGDIVRDIVTGASLLPGRDWQELEIRGYDLNTCLSETTVILKSFFCALAPEELGAFRQKLSESLPSVLPIEPDKTKSIQST